MPPDSNPVGHYFNALYDTGFYSEFIGWAQLNRGHSPIVSAMAVLWKLIGLGHFSNYFNIGLFLTGLGLVFGIVVALHFRFMRIGNLETSEDKLI